MMGYHYPRILLGFFYYLIYGDPFKEMSYIRISLNYDLSIKYDLNCTISTWFDLHVKVGLQWSLFNDRNAIFAIYHNK